MYEIYNIKSTTYVAIVKILFLAKKSFLSRNLKILDCSLSCLAASALEYINMPLKSSLDLAKEVAFFDLFAIMRSKCFVIHKNPTLESFQKLYKDTFLLFLWKGCSFKFVTQNTK